MRLSILADGQYLDIREGEDSRFFINKLLHDLRDMFGRNGDRTRSLVLPRSPGNLVIIGNQAPRYGRDYKYLRCQVLFDGIPVLTDAELAVTGEDDKYYYVNIVGGSATFYNSIPSDSIKDLDLGSFDWNLTTYPDARLNTSGFVAPFTQYFTNDSWQNYQAAGGDDSLEFVSGLDINRAGFGYYARDIFLEILEGIGLPFDISALEEDPIFNETVILCDMPLFYERTPDDTPGTDYLGEVSLLNTYVPPSRDWRIIPFDDIITDIGGVWDAGQYAYSPPVTMRIRLRASIWRNTIIGSINMYTRMIRFRGGQVTVLQNGSWSYLGVNAVFEVDDIGQPGDLYWMEVFSENTAYNISTASNFEFLQFDEQGNEIQINDYLPDLSQRDFIKNFFNLTHIVAADIDSKIVFSFFKDIQTRPSLNLAPFVSKDRQIRQAPRLPGYGQVNEFKYKDEDLIETRLFNAIIPIENNTLEDQVIKIELALASADNSLTQGAVSPQYEIEYQRQDQNKIDIDPGGAFYEYSTLEANDISKGDIIFVDNGAARERYEVRQTFDNKSGQLTATTGALPQSQDWSLLKYSKKNPAAQFLRVREVTGGSFRFMDGNEFRLFTGSLVTEPIPWGNLLEDYYPGYTLMIQNFKVITAWAIIPQSVFIQINSLNPIYLNGDIYYLNKLEQYRQGGLCRLELIRFN